MYELGWNVAHTTRPHTTYHRCKTLYTRDELLGLSFSRPLDWLKNQNCIALSQAIARKPLMVSKTIRTTFNSPSLCASSCTSCALLFIFSRHLLLLLHILASLRVALLSSYLQVLSFCTSHSDEDEFNLQTCLFLSLSFSSFSPCARITRSITGEEEKTQHEAERKREGHAKWITARFSLKIRD